MQEKNLEKQPGKELVINLQLSHRAFALLALGLVVIASLGYLAWGQREAAASSPQAPAAGSTGLRQFYLTKTERNGANVLTACASGYHMASMWEILEPSNLEYNTTLGQTTGDSGQGPPSIVSGITYGWVRTGYNATGTPLLGPGEANCNAWTYGGGGSDINGTIASLVSDWTSGAQGIHVWQVDWERCYATFPVWCVED
jgi:hypothetical protein